MRRARRKAGRVRSCSRQRNAQCPGAVREAMRKNEPYLVTRRIIEIAQEFNRFYYKHRIVTDDAPLTMARLALTDCVRQVIANGLCLIGVEAPRKM